MKSHAKLAGHPIHQMLIVFPLGLLATAVIFDVISKFTSEPVTRGLNVTSYYMIAAGVIAGLLAAIFGLIDYLAIPGATRARRIGTLHGAGNVLVTLLFAVSWLLRGDSAPHVVPGPALALALIGAGLAVFTAWLGGELVDRLGVGVEVEAGLDTPASYETYIDLAKSQSRERPV